MELSDEVQRLTPEEFDWPPRPDMKSFRALLLEIGTMEKISATWLATGNMLEWDMSAYAPSKTLQSGLTELDSIRAETKAYLESIGAKPFPATPEELRAFEEADTKRWAEIVEIAKIEKK